MLDDVLRILVIGGVGIGVGILLGVAARAVGFHRGQGWIVTLSVVAAWLLVRGVT